MKIVYFSNTAWYLYNFRLTLLKQARGSGHEVLLISPEDEYVSSLRDEGFRWRRCPMDRKSLNPLKAGRVLLHLARVFWQERPDLVHNFTLKSIVYGSLAARLVAVPRRVNAIAGLGHYFAAPKGLDSIIGWTIRQLLRASMVGSEVIFQNPDDLETVVRHQIASRDRCHLIRSSGVDIEIFSYQEDPSGPVTVLLASRMLWSKGVDAFVEAGKQLVKDGEDVRFVIAGAPDGGNPDAIPEETLRDWDRLPGIEWWGFQDDMPQVIGQSHIVCLPTRYGEGTPKILTEAAATGRPLVATDVAGCREVVHDGENGFLVAPDDTDQLADSLRTLIRDSSKRKEMGERSRILAEEEFADERVIEKTLSVYEAA
jgi:glycosyltransferase involved in cell wall biosynthesis